MRYHKVGVGSQESDDAPSTFNIQHPTSNIQHSTFGLRQSSAPRTGAADRRTAGHIAVPLAQMAGLYNYAVTVLDDRPGLRQRRPLPPPLRKCWPSRCGRPWRGLPMDADTFISACITRTQSRCRMPARSAQPAGRLHRHDRLATPGGRGLRAAGGGEKGIEPGQIRAASTRPSAWTSLHAPRPVPRSASSPRSSQHLYRGGPATSLSDKRRERIRQRLDERANQQIGKSANQRISE